MSQLLRHHHRVSLSVAAMIAEEREVRAQESIAARAKNSYVGTTLKLVTYVSEIAIVMQTRITFAMREYNCEKIFKEQLFLEENVTRSIPTDSCKYANSSLAALFLARILRTEEIDRRVRACMVKNNEN
ncbi:hypothetical protein EVAR_13389_1 [Eumeta japonica]|uniref:Uncharacterized protein n=1 Tax=Eumeta variegata TaxID=151549 RepID=A0A4C1TS58_EUMVA|nr:hypothetical protein EVAR_13389_1 [Eumeta japonica]